MHQPSTVSLSVAGLPTNINFLKRLANHYAFETGEVETHFIEHFRDDLFVDPNNALLAKEAHNAAGVCASLVAACICEKENGALREKPPAGLSVWYTPFQSPSPCYNGTKARGENENNQQNQKTQIIGLAAAQKKGTIQTGRRPTAVCTATKSSDKPLTSSTAQGQQGHKGEEGKKRTEKKKVEKNGKAAHSVEFYIDIGRDSPNIGDFNVVLKGEKKSNGLPATQYEMSDFQDCCYELGIEDLRAEKAEEELLQGQQRLHDNPRDESLKNTVADLRKKAIRLAEAELSFCSQIAKAKYLKNYDKGIKFFLDLIKRNKSRNHIVSLIDEGGAVCHHLPSAGNLVSEEQALNLIRPVLDEEIKAALFDIGDEIAPGPDGYSSELLRKYSWKRISPRCIMKVDLRKAYDTVNWLEDVLVGVMIEMSMECLNSFGECSGLSINASKSNVYMAGICLVVMEEIKLSTGFSIGEFPFRYLGIPVASSRLTLDQFIPLILKVSEYISVWAGASLSGRSELIKSVLQGVECFWLSILPIPGRGFLAGLPVCRLSSDGLFKDETGVVPILLSLESNPDGVALRRQGCSACPGLLSAVVMKILLLWSKACSEPAQFLLRHPSLGLVLEAVRPS
ncbi:hypothetical protein Acr_28g0004220 [Actinidia rufa]|uniref:Methylcrotonoyl-CoA carboxylase subunit alpha BT domain-containing protein n=1 Tax=Actinidia rufa TaxID=165716 RepID=A0A7J0H9D7_9ERIC|nr:hypothetical protein Acr_28g0004220 [Actinidia rufa]